MNHSLNPNSGYASKEMPSVALRDVAAGEEHTCDYSGLGCMSTADVVASAKNLVKPGRNVCGTKIDTICLSFIIAIFSLLKYNATMQYASLSFSLDALYISERPNGHV